MSPTRGDLQLLRRAGKRPDALANPIPFAVMKIALNCLGVMLLLTQGAAADELDAQSQEPDSPPEGEGLFSVLRNGEFHFIPRYRYEYNDEEGIPNLGKSSTLRTRLNYRAPAARGWTGFLEVDDVRSIGPDLYNSTR